MNIEKEIQKIHQRNKQVELEKSWETSWTRRLTVLFATYIVVLVLFLILKVENPWGMQ